MINGPILANTVYVGNTLVAKDVELKLPEITATTAEVEAMGPMTIANWSRIEDMELAITKIGIDLGLISMITLKPMTIEARFIQHSTNADGSAPEVGHKAFLRVTPKAIPGFEIKPGEILESEITYVATRYQLIRAGKEVLLVDKLSNIMKVNGVDYGSKINQLL